MKKVSESNQLSIPTRKRQILIEAPNSQTIEPHVVAKSMDGGFVVGGSSGTAGWATKSNANGETVWRYSSNLQYPYSSVHRSPAYYGIAPMPDGSTYLCGIMPHAPGSDKPASLLTHVDPNGKLLSENLIAPSGDPGQVVKSGSFQSCTRWGHDVALIGLAYRPVRPASVGAAPVFENYYWVLLLDANGKVKWEKLIPPSNGMATQLGVAHIVLLPVGADLVFSNTDNTNTDLIRLSASGQIKAQKQLSGQFRLAQPVVPDEAVELWGSRRDAPVSLALTLNERFDEIHRLEGYPKGDFVASVVYRLPDRSFCLFGTSAQRSGQNLRSGIVHVDRSLQSAQLFEPIARPGPFFDSGQLTAAAPFGGADEFVAAMMISLHSPAVSGPAAQGMPSRFVRGMAVDFVKLQ